MCRGLTQLCLQHTQRETDRIKKTHIEIKKKMIATVFLARDKQDGVTNNIGGYYDQGSRIWGHGLS